ncbi:hypothetical protein [Actinomadura welshii]|uniref:hypothetical protein n=1 Tax=Actinomadura welshii TaxID=3103817 RepID=UPI0003ACDF54|nr:hypothetical protein [Actinomadura madurae]
MKATDDGAWRHDPAAHLAELRREFPTFGIIADPERPIWMAVRGDDLFIRATGAFVLRQRLQEISNC